MIKNSEALDLARHEYINGYKEKNTTIFPTLNLIAKEFSLSLSTLRKKAANEGWYKKRKEYQNAREEYEKITEIEYENMRKKILNKMTE